MSTPDKTVGTEEHAHAPKNLTLALIVICTAQLMVVLDATIVNIALPSIQQDLGFSQANLQWVLTAYTLAFGGFLLLATLAAIAMLPLWLAEVLPYDDWLDRLFGIQSWI